MKIALAVLLFVAAVSAHVYPYMEVPQDSPDVWAAKMDHFKAYNEAAARVGAAAPMPVYHVGVQETPEVWAAKMEHYRLYNEAKLRSG